MGAGGGGFLMVFSDEGQRALRLALAREGLVEYRFRFDFEGSKVVHNIYAGRLVDEGPCHRRPGVYRQPFGGQPAFGRLGDNSSRQSPDGPQGESCTSGKQRSPADSWMETFATFLHYPSLSPVAMRFSIWRHTPSCESVYPTGGRIIDYNLVGTINVLEVMLENKVPDFVFASTSALYGEAAVKPTPEDYFGIQTSLYGAAKLGGEDFRRGLHPTFGDEDVGLQIRYRS